MKACPECAGELKFDPARKQYVCTSCGLSLNHQDMDDIREKTVMSDPDEERERRRKDYLKWWSQKK